MAKTKAHYVIMDLTGKPLKNIPYKITDGNDKHITKGNTNSKGATYVVSRNQGTEVNLYLKLGLVGYTNIDTSYLATSNMEIRKRFPGFLLDTELQEHKGENGSYKRKTHKVKSGETLTSIASQYGSTAKAIANLNKLSKPDLISIGQILKIPLSQSASGTSNSRTSNTSSTKISPVPQKLTGTYIVKRGDTLAKIAQRAGKTVEELKRANNINSPNYIQVGQKIVIPDGKTSQTSKPKQDVKPKSDNKKPSSNPIKPEVKPARSENTGSPKIDVKPICESSPACIQKGDKSNLILEVNIRLAGFGGALPTNEFTDLTEKCVKQFQRDYMGIAETGKICGSLITALDEFNHKYPVGPYFEQMKCPCGSCTGFGNGRMGVPSGRNIANEYPGIHRSVIWVMKACMFYLSDTKSGYTFRKVNSGYRCIVNNKQKGRTSVNHMGTALDFHFNYASTGSRARKQSDIETIRKKIFVESMGAQYAWKDKNKISLELSKHGATSWVHVDVREFDNKFKSNQFFSKTVSGMVGGELSGIVKDAKLLACAGKLKQPKTTNKGYCPECDKDTAIIVNTNVGDVRISDALMKAIMQWEGSPKKPYVPEGKTSSGITIGYGYDLGHQSAQKARKDLSEFFSGKSLDSLVSVVGKKGDNARENLYRVKHILITKDVAKKMFRNHIAQYAKQTVKIYPEIINLHPDCQGALVSLVYNRGPKLTDKPGSTRRKEMRNIQKHLKSNKLELIPAEIKSMKRIWRNSGQRGLLTRRDGEAEFFRKGLEKHNAHK